MREATDWQQDQRDQQIEDTQKDKYLTFAIGKETFGIEIRYVTEIIGMLPITEVPELPDYLMGIINLRGTIIPVMDIRLRFLKPFKPYDDRTCMIVVDIGYLAIGLIVDSVSEVLTIMPQQIVPPPIVSTSTGSYFKGIGKVDDEVRLLLDCERMLRQTTVEPLINREGNEHVQHDV